MPTSSMYHQQPPPSQPPSSARSLDPHPSSKMTPPPISTSTPSGAPSSHLPLQTTSTTTTTTTFTSTSSTSLLSAPLPPSPSSSSMTLAISKNDATRIIEASRVFNDTLLKLQLQEKRKMKERPSRLRHNEQKPVVAEKTDDMEVDSSSESAKEKASSVKSPSSSSSSSNDANKKSDTSPPQAEEITHELQNLKVKKDLSSSSSEKEGDSIEKKKKDDVSASFSSIPSLKEEMSDADDEIPASLPATRSKRELKEKQDEKEENNANAKENGGKEQSEKDSQEKEDKEEKEEKEDLDKSPQKKRLKQSNSPPSTKSPIENEKSDKTKSTTAENEPTPSNGTSNPSTCTPPPNQTCTPLNKLLIPAAKQCSNSFLQSFVSKMESDESITQEEMETCLLLFLDMDKSSILLTAFAVLGEKMDKKDNEKKLGGDSQEEKKKELSNKSATTTTTTTLVKMEEVDDMEITPTITADSDEIMQCDSSSSSSSNNDKKVVALKSPQDKEVAVIASSPPSTTNHEEEKKDEHDTIKPSPTKSSKIATPAEQKSANGPQDADPPPPPPPSSSKDLNSANAESKPQENQQEENEEDYFELPPEGKLSYQNLILLFKSFLTSISTCIHQEQASPPPQPFPTVNNIPHSPKRPRAPSPHSVTFSPPPPTAAVSASMDDGDDEVMMEEKEKPAKVKKDEKNASPNSAAKRAAEAESSKSASSAVSPPANVSNSMDKTSPATTSVNKATTTPTSKNIPMTVSSTSDQDWTLSSQTKKEIQEIATYAADQLVLFLQNGKTSKEDDEKTEKAKKEEEKQKIVKSEENAAVTTPTLVATSKTSGTEETKEAINKENVLVSFETFGEWYNAGGFSLVPWLELLDLAKWDYAGKAAAAAAEAAAAEAASAAVLASAMNAPLDTPGGPTRSHRRFSSGGAGFIDEEDRHHVGALEGFGPSPTSSSHQPLTPANYNDSRYNQTNNSSRPSSSLRRRPNPDPTTIVPPQPSSPELDIFTRNKETSRTVVSFDFTASMPSPSQEFNINITEENLQMLKHVVHRTGLIHKSLEEISSVLLRYSICKKLSSSTARTTSMGDCDSNLMILNRQDFGKCIRELVSPEYSKHFDEVEMENYSNYFTNFYTCFDKCSYSLGENCANTKELAIGLSFLCAGNKSTKLSTAFELLDEGCRGYLTQRGLTQYLRSYLIMLIGISLLSSSTSVTAETRKLLMGQQAQQQQTQVKGQRERSDVFAAVENGAKWTMGYFLRSFMGKVQQSGRGGASFASTRCNAVTFEDFAEWYTEGGYTVAPWLELLDLSKFLSLLPEERSLEIQRSSSNGSGNNQAHPKHMPPLQKIHPSEVLFTFPLANHQSLVVLREDAAYVRDVVTQLNLLSFSCDDVWSSLLNYIRKNPPYWQTAAQRRKNGQLGGGKSADIDASTFVNAVDSIINPASSRNGNKKKQQSRTTTVVNSAEAKDTLKNFFSSFDLEQVDRVAVNQLMGGLTLLCGGKKSTKLAFSFGLFDGRTAKEKRKRGHEAQSLDKKELFYFFRSFLIVMFSCCKQSLDLSAEAVGRYISETANMVANDVVMYQWNTRRTDRVDFDNFGEWYNEGGFKTAPWLELLDLKKWVLLDGPIDAAGPSTQGETRDAAPPSMQHREENHNGPPPPPPPPPREEHMDEKSQKAEGAAAAAAGGGGSTTNTKNENNDEETLPPPAEDDQECPPPPPDDAMDPANDPFLGDMGLDEMDGVVDDMDYILQQASTEASETTQTKDSSGGDQQETAAAEKPIKEENQDVNQVPAASAPPPEPAPPANTKKQTKRQQNKNDKENKGNYVTNNTKARDNTRSKPAPTTTTNSSSSRPTQSKHDAHQQPPPPGKSLKFHLLTNEEHGGYMISISQRRIQHLRQLVCESGLYKLDGSLACDRILKKAVQRRQGADSVLTLTKEEFDSAMRSVVSSSASSSSRGEAGMSTETQQYLSDLLTAIFRTFDRTNSGKVNALELACGFTVLCGGRKSDKLEYAFELLDEKKQGHYCHDDMIRYLQSFLLVLLSISSSSSLARDSREDVMTTMEGTHCGNGAATILRVIDYGSTWATKQVFRSVLGANANCKSKSKANRPCICFDDFAEWYTRGGYTSIQWLELLDLRKWVLADKT